MAPQEASGAPSVEASIIGVIPKWMVYKGKSHLLEMDDDWWYPHDYGNPHFHESKLEK